MAFTASPRALVPCYGLKQLLKDLVLICVASTLIRHITNGMLTLALTQYLMLCIISCIHCHVFFFALMLNAMTLRPLGIEPLQLL